MPIDLDGLALIDSMLNAIIELRLMPDVNTQYQQEDLNSIHDAVLLLNDLWQQENPFEFSENPAALAHALRKPLNPIIGFTKVLKSGVDGIMPSEAHPYLETLETISDIVLSKIGYYSDKYHLKN